MRKLTAILGLSLLVANTLFAQNNITNDVIEKTLYYTKYSNRGHFTKNEVQTLAKSPISDSVLKAIYPEDDYLYLNSEKGKTKIVILQPSTISNKVLKAIYSDDVYLYQ